MDSAIQHQRIPSGLDAETRLFWYSRHTAAIALFFYFLIVLAISCVIPPLQPPDEMPHIMRAYLLSRGDVFLGTKDGKTGGYIDTGLLAYMSSFGDLLGHYEKKVATEVRSSSRINWSGRREFTPLFSTAVYFPLPYLPQASAFAIGERIGLSPEATCYLGRLFSLAATLGLLWCALILYPMPPVVVTLFATPMTLFQLGSATLDPVTFGTCALTSALFLRGSDPQRSFDTRLHLALALCVFSLATSRIAMLPLTLLPATLYKLRRSRVYLLTSAASFCLSICWILFAFVSVKGMPSRAVSTLDTAKHYLEHPTSLFRIVLHTFWNGDVMQWYWSMFIGLLGEVDTPLDPYVYAVFAVLFIVLIALSLQRDTASWTDPRKLLLLSVALVCLGLNFILELLTWTTSNARVIGGIQGRYFTPIWIFIGYSILGRKLSPLELRCGVLVLLVALTLSIVSMIPKLLYRYWVS